MDPDRDAPVFAATEYVTVPLPEPEDPEVIVIHEVEVEAVHEQPACVVTTMEWLPPAATTLCEVGDTPYVQLTVVPSCVIVTTDPATLSVPFLDEPVGFAATE